MPTAAYFGWRESPISPELLRYFSSKFELKFHQQFSFGEKPDQRAILLEPVDFLFNFGPLIIKQPILDAVRIAAINFHTAPPEWPGRGSCSFALYHGDRTFGVTAHLVALEVDSGAILNVIRFPIDDSDTAESLNEKALARVPDLVAKTVESLRQSSWAIKASKEIWSRKALKQRDLEDLMRIGKDSSRQEIERKIRAFQHSTKPGPYVELGGFKFWYLKDRQ